MDYWLRNHLGWDDDGSDNYTAKRDEEGTQPAYGDEQVNESNITISAPQCKHDDGGSKAKGTNATVSAGSEKSEVWWKVNNNGDKQHDLAKRTPPVSAKDYVQAIAFLRFMPGDEGPRSKFTQGGTSCKKTCPEPYYSLAQSSCSFISSFDCRFRFGLRYSLRRWSRWRNSRCDGDFWFRGCGVYVYYYEDYTMQAESKPDTLCGLESGN
ncbi:hypothetical protein N7512_008041 [Penicillium capsulatum]|nr:hypothetical protein N7512_008041 [Penicillium capsulatum]